MSEKELKTLCQVYENMNKIRARDGAPHGICHEWWDKLTDEVNDIVETRTGHTAWLNPLLYKDLGDSAE